MEDSLLNIFKKYTYQTSARYVYYTAIFGNYDDLKKPCFNESADHRFICFTDNKTLLHRNTGWEIILVDECHRDPRRTAKVFKILPHRFLSGCHYSIWTDGKNELLRNITPIIANWGNFHFRAFPHPSRICAYEEADVCKLERKDLPELLERQTSLYKKNGLVKNFGLVNGSFIVRNHRSLKIEQFMEDWWYEIESHSVRDQVSLPYILWKNKITNFKINENPQKYIYNHGHEKEVFFDHEGNTFNVKNRFLKEKCFTKLLRKIRYLSYRF